jgi:spoIIIJ-associated protein
MTNGNETPVVADALEEVTQEPRPSPQEESKPGGRPRRSHSRRRNQQEPRDDQAQFEGDERAREALGFVSTLLQQMSMDCRARLCPPREAEVEGQAPEIVVEVYGRDSGRIIGKRGQVLAALQFLTHRAVNRPGVDRRHVIVDAEGYRLRRESTLATMAQRLGQQAVDEGKIITFEPMNPRDRRVVHLALAKFEGVITKSEGEGDERRVQIIPVRR